MIIIENTTNQIVPINDLGMELGALETRDITSLDRELIRCSDNLLSLIGNGSVLMVKDALSTPKIYYSVADAVRVIAGYNPAVMPVNLPDYQKGSENKIVVQNTYRPVVAGKNFLTTWVGAGDNGTNLGQGTPFKVQTDAGTVDNHIDIDFNFAKGGIYVHHAYFCYENAGFGDEIRAQVWAHATPMAAVPGGAYIIDNHLVKYVGAGNGDHTLAGQPTLLAGAGHGFWDYNGVLTPNPAGTGAYNISDLSLCVYNILNNFQVYGTVYSPIIIQSFDVNQLQPGYFLRVTAVNNSQTAWKCWFNVMMYREQTV